MVILRILILLFSLVFLGTANENLKNPFLWEVTKGKQHFYLFGTMHLATPELQTLPQSLIKIIHQSDAVYTEIELDTKSQLEVVKYIMREDNRTLQEILPLKLYQDLETYLATINPQLTMKPFQQMKIWGVASTLSLVKYQLKYPRLKAIDQVIYTYARTHNIPVGGVETLAEQFGAMDSFSQEEQINYLESTLAYLNGHEDLIEKLKQHYIEGNAQKTLIFINSMMYQIPKYKALEEKLMQRLLYDRNIRMAQRIDKIVQTDPRKQFLFAFGVMHFLGERSVIQYLQNYGYLVKRVK